jgi:hypothetical protein
MNLYFLRLHKLTPPHSLTVSKNRESIISRARNGLLWIPVNKVLLVINCDYL